MIANWHKARLKMTKAEVRELFGEPTAQRGPAKIECEGDSEPTIAAAAGLGAMFFGGFDESWEYAPPHYQSRPIPEEQQKTQAELQEKLRNLSEEELAELREELARAIFGDPSDEAFVVYFNLEGRVKGLRAPVRGSYARYPSMGEYPGPVEGEPAEGAKGG